MTLIENALSARKQAYSPYSNFMVGAALRCNDGSIFTGCNIENKSYSLTICAERNAIFQAIAKGNRDFKSIAIVGGADELTAKTIPCIPCGACLQVLAEFCKPDFPILLADGVHLLKEFLPVLFNLPE